MKRQWFLVVLAGLVAGCAGGSDSGVQPINRAPSINFTTDKIGVVKGVPATLSVSVSDPDGDPLTVTWEFTRNATYTPQNAAKTIVNWAVPPVVGVDTVTVTVSDGSLVARIREPMKVGTATSGNRAVYRKLDSPYIVTSDSVDVGERVEVTIEAGTELLLDQPDTRIDVNGLLKALGTVSERVVIRPNRRNLSCAGDKRAWWAGISGDRAAGAAAPGEVLLDYTDIWYAQDGVTLRSGARASLLGCAIRCSGEAGVFHDSSGYLLVRDSEISNGLKDGLAIGREVSSSLPDSVRIERCELIFNGRNGLYVNIADQDNTHPIIVEYCDIENNLLHGVVLERASFPALHFNSFRSNGVGTVLSNIYLEDGFPNGAPVDTLDATLNYFFVTTQVAIEETIRDSQDNPGLVKTFVKTKPWLTTRP